MDAEQDPKDKTPVVQKVISFFRDPEKPLALRLGLAALLVLTVLSFFMNIGGPSKDKPPYQDSFPSGPSGLADSNGEADRLKALAGEMKARQAEEARAPAPETGPQDIDAEQNAAEPDASGSGQKDETKAPSGTPGPFVLLGQHMPRPFTMAVDEEQALWLAHRYGLTLLRESSPEAAKVVLDRNSYDNEFNDDLPPITAFALLPDKSAWIGFANGQVMRYQRYEWQILARPQEAVKKAVTAIGGTKKELFVGSRGLFKFDAGFKRFLPDPEFRDKQIHSFFFSKTEVLYMGGAGGVWSYDVNEHRWTQFWQAAGADRRVRVIQQDEDGSLLLGTGNGIVRMSEKGYVAERMLPGEDVNALVVQTGGKLWAGTREHGLMYWDGEQWFTAGRQQGLGDRITALQIDRNNRLWCGVDGVGVFSAAVPEAEQWMHTFKQPEEEQYKFRQFDTFCHAAQELLKGPGISGDIAAETLDGRLFVFVRGQLACPRDAGHRRPDGSIVLVRGRSITLFSGQNRTELKIPEEMPVERTQAALLDSRGRLWLGTETAGVIHLSGERWQRFGADQQLEGNPVTSILEDTEGNTWIGTSPKYDEAQQRYLLPNLHLHTNEGWFHYSPKEGLIFNNTQTLALLRDGTLLVGSMAGFSLINKKGQITNFGKEQGLDPWFVFSTAVDRKDNIWLAHQYFGDGVTVVGKRSFHRIDSAHGLFNDRISVVAHDRASRVWLMASNGRAAVYAYSELVKMKESRPIDQKRVMTRDMFH